MRAIPLTFLTTSLAFFRALRAAVAREALKHSSKFLMVGKGTTANMSSYSATYLQADQEIHNV